MSARA